MFHVGRAQAAGTSLPHLYNDDPGADLLVDRFRHDGQSWQRLWDQIGKEVGASFETSWSGKRMVTDHHEQGALMTEVSVRRL